MLSRLKNDERQIQTAETTSKKGMQFETQQPEQQMKTIRALTSEKTH